MTRINAAIKPAELPSKLLLAELREIKRIPNTINKAKLEGIPEVFRLGGGHVKFFYDKGLYTLKRYLALREESINRGFNVQDFSGAWGNYPKELMNDWVETKSARQLIIERIQSKGFELLIP